MTKTINTLVFLCLSLTVFSQSNVEGTFQLMTTSPKAQEIFTTELYTIVENERLESNTAIVKVGDFTWVRILSTSAINDPNFTPLSDEIIVIDPNDVRITTNPNESNN